MMVYLLSDQAADSGAQENDGEEGQADYGRGPADGAAPVPLVGGHFCLCCAIARRVGPKAMSQRETWRWC